MKRSLLTVEFSKGIYILGTRAARPQLFAILRNFGEKNFAILRIFDEKNFEVLRKQNIMHCFC